MSAHSPRPWTCDPPERSGHVHVIRAKNGRCIAHVGSDLPDDARQAANAALIAAAPDLLMALLEATDALSVAVREAVNMPGFDPERDHEVVRKARAVIAKAVRS